MGLMEKTPGSDKLLSGMRDNAVGCEFILVNQQHALNKVSLNRSTCETSLHIGQLVKML